MVHHIHTQIIKGWTTANFRGKIDSSWFRSVLLFYVRRSLDKSVNAHHWCCISMKTTNKIHEHYFMSVLLLNVFCSPKIVCLCAFYMTEVENASINDVKDWIWYEMKWISFLPERDILIRKWLQRCPYLVHLRCKFDVTQFAISRLLLNSIYNSN